MGCGQSKIENEEAVACCKDRKLFMKSAVSHRHAFASSHSAYAVSLKNIGAALSDYAQGRVLLPLPPPLPFRRRGVLFDRGSGLGRRNGTGGSVTTGFETLHPPPPLPGFGLQRAATMPEMVLPKAADGKAKHGTIMEEGEEGDRVENDEESGSLRQRSRRRKGKAVVAGRWQWRWGCE